MKQLNQDFKIVQIVPIATIVATLEGDAIDTKVSEMFSNDTALINVEIGDLGSQATTVVKIEEDDDADFSDPSEIAGGEEFAVEKDTSYSLQVERTKRYIRAVITIAGGSGPSAEVFIGGILWNAAIPFPVQGTVTTPTPES